MNKQHDLYINNLVGDIKANPRDFYRYINSQKKDIQGIPPLKRRNGNGLGESEMEQVDQFNGQFTDVYNKSEHTQVPLPNRSAPFIHVSAEGVTKLLKGLNPSKALGSDELHPRFLEELASELGPMFAHLFCSKNLLARGKSPRNCHLQTYVSCTRKEIELIFLTCVPCKLPEHIICSNIMAHLGEHKLLSDRQHAFR